LRIGRHKDDAEHAWEALLAACAVKSRQFEYAERAVEFLRDAFDLEQTLDALAERVTQLDDTASRDEHLAALSGALQSDAAEKTLDGVAADFTRCEEKRARLADRLQQDFRQAENIDETLIKQVIITIYFQRIALAFCMHVYED
jgi:hypothetical protein